MDNPFKTIDWRAQVFPKRDDLPTDLTTIDILKSAALVLMIVDHVGWLMFPDILWLRVLGRLCVPLWFFLIGYARTREIPVRWFIATGILLLSSLLVGLPGIPLSVLMTMAVIRLCQDRYWLFVKTYPVYFWWTVLLLIFCSIPTGFAVEYGTMGFLLAMFGYAVRNRDDVEQAMGDGFTTRLAVVALLSFGTLESLWMGFSLLQAMCVYAGLVGTYFVLVNFEAKTLLGAAAYVQAPLVRFMGRYTLEIYVLHLLILKAVYGLQMAAQSLF